MTSNSQRYATYQGMMGSGAEGYVYMAFPREIPSTHYIQALPQMMLFYNCAKCVT